MIQPDRIHELARRLAYLPEDDFGDAWYSFNSQQLEQFAKAIRDEARNEALDEVLARLQQGFGTTSAPVTTIRRHFAAQHLPPDDTEGGDL